MSVAQAVYVKGPKAGDNTKFQLTTSTTVYQVPKSWRGRWVRFCAEGGDLYLTFCEQLTDTFTTTSVSTRGGGGEISNSATIIPLVASSGSFTDYYCIPNTTQSLYFAVIGSNATGYWSAHVSDHTAGVPV